MATATYRERAEIGLDFGVFENLNQRERANRFEDTFRDICEFWNAGVISHIKFGPGQVGFDLPDMTDRVGGKAGFSVVLVKV